MLYAGNQRWFREKFGFNLRTSVHCGATINGERGVRGSTHGSRRGRTLPRKRGRPTRAAAALYWLGQLLPLLEPKGERAFIRKAVQEVVWNADTRAILLALKLKAVGGTAARHECL